MTTPLMNEGYYWYRTYPSNTDVPPYMHFPNWVVIQIVDDTFWENRLERVGVISGDEEVFFPETLKEMAQLGEFIKLEPPSH